MEILKHIGKRKDSGVRVAIVFMQIPSDPEYCLVVDMDSMYDLVRDEFYELVVSKEAQQSRELYQLLDRTHYKDNKSWLVALHDSRNMMKLKTDEIIVTPFPNQSISLTELNVMLRKINEGTVDIPEEQLEASKNVRQQQIELAEKDQLVQHANNILFQAQELEEQAKLMIADAHSKRKVAESMLQKVRPTAKPVEISKEAAIEVFDEPKKRGRKPKQKEV